MAGNIFINYRRDESGHVAGRLHESLAPKFGRNKLFMDVDNIPVGRDFEEYLNSQVTACDAMLALIGPNWVNAKDETGQRRLDNPEDFVAIEIQAALSRNIPVVPVLVDGARMPRASELPDSLKPLARRQAVQVRHTNFNSDAETLVKRLREALGYNSPVRRWRVRAMKVVAVMAVMFVVGWVGYQFNATNSDFTGINPQKAEQDKKAAVEAAVRAERDRQARAPYEAQERRKAAEAEVKQTLAAKPGQERYSEAMKQGEKAIDADQYERAIAYFTEAISLNPSPDAFLYRGLAYLRKDDFDRAIADNTEAIRLSPNNPPAFNNRGLAHYGKSDFDLALADYNEAIRLDPFFADAFCNRGDTKRRIKDPTGDEDTKKATKLGGLFCMRF
jgi:tetratricopeptide (TPR) repeat protein